MLQNCDLKRILYSHFFILSLCTGRFKNCMTCTAVGFSYRKIRNIYSNIFVRVRARACVTVLEYDKRIVLSV
jgi:hypothetical protein